MFSWIPKVMKWIGRGRTMSGALVWMANFSFGAGQYKFVFGDMEAPDYKIFMDSFSWYFIAIMVLFSGSIMLKSLLKDAESNKLIAMVTKNFVKKLTGDAKK